MPNRVQVAEHLSLEELERHYRQAKAGIERSHYQMLWFLAQGRSPAEVSQLTGYSRDCIYKVLRTYNQHGPSVLGDQRRHNPGQAPLLDAVQQTQLWQTLQTPPGDGDLWDGPKVAHWMSEVLGRPIHPQRGWEYLKSLEMRRRRPRPEHVLSDCDTQDAWEKTRCNRS